VSPTENRSVMATGMSAPTTHNNCCRTAKRAKVRPCAPGATLRCVMASKVGCATAAHSPSQPANTTCALRVGCDAATPAPTPVASSDRASNVDSGNLVAHPGDNAQADEGTEGAHRESEGEVAEAGVLTSKPKGQQERGEADGEAHERSGRQSPGDFNVTQGVERVPVPLRLRETGHFVTHLLGWFLQTQTRDRRADEDEGRGNHTLGAPIPSACLRQSNRRAVH